MSVVYVWTQVCELYLEPEVCLSAVVIFTGFIITDTVAGNI